MVTEPIVICSRSITSKLAGRGSGEWRYAVGGRR
jgi:hypothetical protein